MALALHMLDTRPKEFLELPPLERRCAAALATELEQWRWKQLQTLLGG